MTQTKKPATHAEAKYFKKTNGHITIAGKNLFQLAAIAGQTPFYVYDRQVILKKIAEFKQYIPEAIHLHYAMKANPHPSLVSFVANHVDGLDVASQGELLVALATDTAPTDISFAGPGKTQIDIDAAVASGIVLNLESVTEFERAIAAGKKLGCTPRVAVRVNPDFELKTSGMKMGGGPKQFGIDAELVPDFIKKITQSNAEFYGLHIFSGSQNLKPEALIEAHDKTFALAKRLVEETNVPLKKLNIGGGFGIPYFPGENHLELSDIGINLTRLLDEYRQTFSGTEIIIELGRFIVGESGLYVSSITDIKTSRGQKYLITDGGLHHHLSNSGNFGQVIRKNYPVDIIQQKDTEETELVSIVGPLCTPLDILGDKMSLPKADIGDLVAIYQSGAYGKTASPREFLSQPELKEIFL